MIDILASQLPMAQDYLEVTRTQWNASRHKENVRDVVGAINDEDVSRFQKLGAIACLMPIVWALGPGNEMTLASGVGFVLDKTDSVNAAIATTPAITTPLEAGAGLGMAYVISKFPKATDVIRERYIKKLDKREAIDSNSDSEGVTDTMDEPKKSRKFFRTLGIVSLTGTGATGASIDTSLHDSNPIGRHNRTKRTVILAAGMLGIINTGYVAAILGATKGVDKLSDSQTATNSVVSFISNPAYVGTALVGGVLAKQQYDYFIGKRQHTKREKLAEIDNFDNLKKLNTERDRTV